MGDIIRVAHVIGSVAKGGVEAVVFNYYKFIDNTLVQFDFIIDEDSPCEIPEDILALGCKVYKIPSYKHLSAYIKSLKNIFTDNKYQIVHSHMNTLSVFTLYAAKKSKVPVRIAHAHSTAGKGEFYRNVMKYTLRLFSKKYPTHLCACSEHAGRWQFGNKAFNTGQVTVFKNAIDVSKFVYNEDIRNKVRQDLKIEDKFVIGHVGRFCTTKNHTFLIDVFNEVQKREENSVLLLVGDGELKRMIENKVKKLGLQNSVIFLGNKNDVNEIYQAMDVFVLPSLYEGLGIVAIEAQIAGLPTIVSDKVPFETKINNTINYINLKQNKNIWADIIFYDYKNASRYNIEFKKTDYEIKNVVYKMEKIYSNMCMFRTC